MTCAGAVLSMSTTPGTEAVADDVGVLVRSCAEATLAHIDASVDELGQAGALLGDAMGVLRASFAAALGLGARRHHLEAAMVALQCEDALLQMLESMRRRSLQAAEALRCAVAPEAASSRLRQAVSALNAGTARAGPVRQQRAVVGTVDLF